MPAITEAQEKRIRDIRTALLIGQDLKALDPPVKREDVKMLIDRIDDLDGDTISCADEIVQWARDRLEEDLRQKRSWLEDAIDNARTAELMVREAEHALKALNLLKETGIYASGDEINARWDAMADLYRSQAMLPVPEPVEDEAQEPAPEEPMAPPPEPPPATAEPDAPAKPPFVPRPPMAVPLTHEEKDRLVMEALRVAAGDEQQIQVSLSILGAKSGVSDTFNTLHRLKDAGLIEIIPDKPEKGTPRPNIYRFIEAAVEKPQAFEPNKLLPIDEVVTGTPALAAAWKEATTPEEPVAAEVVAEKLAGSWGAKIKPRPSGAVPRSASLRDRIIGTLQKAACTSSGLASMLDVKELAVCQTLDSMKHEGTVSADEMPEAGRRAQLWRLPVAEPSPQ